MLLVTMCRKMIVGGRTPIVRAACTYSRLRSDSASPRTSRAGTSHAVTPTTMISISTLGLNTVARKISRNRAGMASSASTTRIISPSAKPPR